MIPTRHIIKVADKRYMVTEGNQIWYFEVIRSEEEAEPEAPVVVPEGHFDN
jgi:hypothetical protein